MTRGALTAMAAFGLAFVVTWVISQRVSQQGSPLDPPEPVHAGGGPAKTAAAPARSPGMQQSRSDPIPGLTLPQLSELDRVELEAATTERARRTRRALLNAAAARAYASGCLASDPPAPTLLEARFQVEVSPHRLVARSPALTVRKGAPLDPQATACLAEAFREPVTADAAPPQDFLSAFSGSSRVEIGIGDCSRL